jgi:hypothetical protein
MTQKNKYIIIIVGAVLIFAIFVVIVFDLFPSKEISDTEQDTNQEQVDLSFLGAKEDVLPESKVFDSSNSGELDILIPSIGSKNKQSALEIEAQNLAEFFIERFGTYSNDDNFAHVDDLSGFMTDSMNKWTKTYKQQQPVRDSYFAISAEIAQIETANFSLSNRSAEYNIVVNRIEEPSMNQYSQEVVINLEQDNNAQWRVGGVFWGERK